MSRPLLPPPEAFGTHLEVIWRTARLSNAGPFQLELEARLEEVLGVRHLSLWNNGTIALLGACRGLGLRGEVITTPFTFPATVDALAWLGLEPVFADVEPGSLCLDPATVEQALTPRTSAILPVHVYGTPCDVAGLAAVARDHGLRLIYDAAHAFGCTVDGTPIGNFGDVSMFSFHATKLFHTAEGGALATADPDLKARFDLLRNFGIADEVNVPLVGINGKLNELQAALGLAVLPLIEAEKTARRQLAERYASGLAGVPGLAVLSTNRGGVDHYLILRLSERELGLSAAAACARLREFNIHARRYFYPLVSVLPAYRDLPSAHPARLPVAARAASECLALPLYGTLPPGQVDHVCAVVRWLADRARRGSRAD